MKLCHSDQDHSIHPIESTYMTNVCEWLQIITSGGVTYKNEPWHKECFTCTNCTKSLAGERFTSKNEKPYCAECFGELFAKRCTSCAKPITGTGSNNPPVSVLDVCLYVIYCCAQFSQNFMFLFEDFCVSCNRVDDL